MYKAELYINGKLNQRVIDSSMETIKTDFLNNCRDLIASIRKSNEKTNFKIYTWDITMCNKKKNTYTVYINFSNDAADSITLRYVVNIDDPDISEAIEDIETMLLRN